MKEEELGIQEHLIAEKIYEIRGERVMLSSDLAELYEVETKVLNQQVKRNIDRFPERYMFKLRMDEYKESIRSQNVTLKRGKHSKYAPYAFTEHGVLMLSSVLRSKRAEQVNVIIIDTFVKMRNLLLSNKDLNLRMDYFEGLLENHDEKLTALYKHLKGLFEDKEQEISQSNRRKIGYKSEEEE